ncbi:LytR/AlgR family response regulator transcription factor [Nitritalea halalkaliphila]|uniref:LytR/AlgR family response regulator transcription factor n=1 Tax=Nitritalea halalkaliphila TaxID=590849 RepID=UPI0002FCD08D|nr:response regulator [Nitritalea halalkaliphila]
MKCVIVDDDIIFREILKKLISEEKDLDLVASCSHALEAMEFLTHQEADLLFLDVEMPLISGIELLDKLERKPLVIFVTAKDEYALKAFEQEAVHYITKPVDRDKFQQAISRARARYKLLHGERVKAERVMLTLKVNGEQVRIAAEDLLLVEAASDYMLVQTEKKKYVVHSTLKAFVESVGAPYLLRVHKSFAVNPKAITKIGARSLWLADKEVPLGPAYKKALKDWE